jgi:hypothetical protein
MDLVHWVSRFGVSAWLLWSSACQREAPAPPQAEPARVERPTRTCDVNRPLTHHDGPENAYAAYAEAVNQARWCDAIGAMEAASKPRVVVGNFKGLAQLAGTANPKQREYAAALKQLCQRHHLDCASDAWLMRFVAASQTENKGQSYLAAVTKLAESAPDTTYLEIMDALQSVEADKMARLDPAVFSVENRGDTAIGYAKRAGTHPHQVSFVRTPQGWMIAMPK